MIIRKLIIDNFGLFAGKHEFDLAPRTKYHQQRPIILFGGQNGAGKTTLLEALRLVLYGRLSLGPRVRQVDYTAFLRGRIHRERNAKQQPNGALIGVEFDHVHRGVRDRYYVERSWEKQGASDVSENVTVKKNDDRLDEVEAEFWQSFVRDIIPEGLAQLFFFDGEKIRELAEDSTGTGVLADSIKSLLGLDLVERLNADLTVYSNREVAKVGSAEDRNKAAAIDAEVKAFREAITEVNEELASNRTRHDGVVAEVTRAEENLRREGEDLARRRQNLQDEAGSIKVKIESAERELRSLCDETFPFALCPKTAKLLKHQLKDERTQAHSTHVHKALTDVRQDLRQFVVSRDARRAGLSRDAAGSLQKGIDKVLEEHLSAISPATNTKPVHHLSETDYRRVVQWLSQAQTRSLQRATRLCKTLNASRKKLDWIERQLAQAPSDETVAPQVNALRDLNRRLGALEESRCAAEERLKRLTIDCDQKERELRRIAERYQGGMEATDRIKLAHSVQTALGEYLRRLTKLKISQLRQAVTTCFNRLCRKGDIIKSINIDAETFSVTLYDRANNAIPKEELSSGEKQIYAIAMLWGLASTSGRPLPIIIDTPLGRLDSEHRRKLIEEYFPNASHQVILLSTDTEVDKELFAALSPVISHSYQLVYDPSATRTEVEEGYFWRKKEAAYA